MAINVIGGAGSTSSGGTANYGGLNVVTAGWATTGTYTLATPRKTKYALSHQDGAGGRLVLDYGGAGNVSSTNLQVLAGNSIGIAAYTTLDAAVTPTAVNVYSQWARRTTPANANGGVGYLNGTYFFGNSAGNIYSSPDLTTYTLRATPVASVNPRGFAYGNSVYVAVGWDGATTAMNATSTDGVTWTNRAASNFFTDVTFGAGRFFATVSATVNGHYSTDGFTWTATTVGGTVNQVKHNGLAAGSGSLFVAVGSGGIFSSPDGITWTSRTNPSGQQINSVAYGGGVWVGVGQLSTIISSTNGTTWTNRANNTMTASQNITFQHVDYGSGRFVANGDLMSSGASYGGGYASTDGITWRPVGGVSNNGIPSEAMGAYKYGGGTFFATAGSTYIATSADGLQCGGAGFALMANALPLIN
jgi:hypothetical protein